MPSAFSYVDVFVVCFSSKHLHITGNLQK